MTVHPNHTSILRWAAVLLVAVTGTTWADGSNLSAELESMKAEMQRLRNEVTQLRAASSDSWLTERRAEEVKTLVRDVLADADTRASLAEGKLAAGHDGKNFFLASEDGNFLLKIAGQVQFRYIYNSRNSDDTAAGTGNVDEEQGGFTMRRAKLKFFGHAYDPKLKYYVSAEFNRDGGAGFLENAWLSYDFMDQHYIKAGQFKGRFLREELVSSTAQLAAERSNVNEFFTLGYTQGIAVGGNYEKINWSIIVHDGREVPNADFHAFPEQTDIAIAGRVELLLAGNWNQFKDFVAWSKDEFGLMVGAGLDYENAEGGGPVAWEHSFSYTFDASLELHPFNAFVAFVGRSLEGDAGAFGPFPSTDDDAHQWGIVAQVGVFLVPDKWDVFFRYEHLDGDGVTEVTGATVFPGVLGVGTSDDLDIFTFGTNYYVKGHNVKLTADIQYIPDSRFGAEDGAGQIGNANVANIGDEEWVFRGQVQLLF